MNNERLGEIRKNKESLGGYEMKIVEYNSNKDMIIEFQDKYKARIHTAYKEFKRGNIKNPFHPSVYGVGYIGRGKYKSGINGKQTKVYLYWKHILERCYDPYYINKHLTYIDCYVCEEWHNFQNFAEWFYKKYYEVEGERMELDKDILYKNNKIYSPKTCIFVPKRINVLFNKQQRNRGKLPIGCSYHSSKTKIIARCQILKEDGKMEREHLGCFSLNRPFQAFTVYKNYKENYIKQVADEYKELIPVELYNAMYRYEVEIND